jgi:hypothetical protein
VKIGFVGFGEAGSTIAGGLRSAGVYRTIRIRHQRVRPVLRTADSDARRAESDQSRYRHRADNVGSRARRQDAIARLDLRSRFGPDGPKTYHEVLDVLGQMM